MVGVLGLVGFAAGGVMLIVTAFHVVYKRGFKHPCIVVSKVGDSTVAALDDFKVSTDNEGRKLISFYKHPNKTPAPQGNYLNKFLKTRGTTTISDDDLQSAKDVGGMFYSPSRGVYKPLLVKWVVNPKTGKEEPAHQASLAVVNEDDKQFQINQIQKEHRLHHSSRDKLYATLIVGGAIIASVILVIVTLTIAGDSGVQIAAAKAPTIVENIQGAVGG